jgi:hypothetical protein
MAQVDQAQVQTPVLERDRQKDREKKKKKQDDQALEELMAYHNDS